MRTLVIGLVALLVSSVGCDDGEPGDIVPGGGSSAAGGQSSGGNGSGASTAACSLGELGSCGDGQKCSVVDPVSGTVACVTAGNSGSWTACTVDTDCTELSYCDALTGVCKPLCDSADDCAGDGRCVQARVSLGEPISGLSLCTAGCHPLTGAPCNLAAGDVACVAHNPGDDIASLDCVTAASGTEDTPCTMQTVTSSRSDCVQGLMCVMVAGQSSCKRWCTQPGAQAECDAGETCTDAGVSHMAAAFGVCP